MKVNVQSQNRKISDAFETLTPINNILYFFGLNCIDRVNGELKSFWSLTKNIIISLICFTLNSVAIYFKLQTYTFNLDGDSLTFMDILQWTFLLGFAQYIIGLIIVFKYGTKTTILYYNAYNIIDNIIGMMCYRQIKMCTIKIIIFFLVITITASIFDYAAWYLCYDWKAATIYALEYFYNFIKMLILLETVCHVIQIEYRLKMFGHLLEDLYSTVPYIPGLHKDVVAHKDWIYSIGKDKLFLDWLKTDRGSRFGDLTWLGECYLLLIEQISYINTVFGFKMLLLCISYLMDMIDSLNLAIRIIVRTMVLKVPYPAVTSLLRLVACGAISLTIVYRCERCYRENERIIRIIDNLMVNKKISEELRTTLKDFRDLVITRPVNFNGSNFFRLDYPLMVSMSSVVVTYTIIFLQNMN